MKRILVTIGLMIPGSVALGYAVPDISFGVHLGLVCLLFFGGILDGKFNWD